MKHLDYVISKTSSTRREDGAYDYFMVHLALILPTGDIELTQGMIVARDFLFDLI